MTDNQLATAAVAEEKVEILDNNDHVAWVDVVDGNWTYTPTSLPYGEHRFTARYGGRTSSDWPLIVQARRRVDDFEDAAEAEYTTLVRPFFTATAIVTGWPAEKGMAINYASGTETLYLEFWAVRSASVDFTTTVNVVFKELCESVEILAFAFHTPPRHTNKVDAIGENQQVVASEDFSSWGEGEIRRVILKGGDKISSLRFQLVPGLGLNPREFLWVDEIVLIG